MAVKQIATAWDGTAYEVYQWADGVELLEDSVLLEKFDSYATAREAADTRSNARLRKKQPTMFALPLKWKTYPVKP